MAAASPRPRDATPPPVIGKAGRYTVFITPPSTPAHRSPIVGRSTVRSSPASPVPAVSAPSPPVAPSPVQMPPIQVPPLQFEKRAAGEKSLFGFFWNAVARVQDAHSSLDEYLADWFGLDQSKYQWALNDYYENNNGKEKVDGKAGKKEQISVRGQSV